MITNPILQSTLLITKLDICHSLYSDMVSLKAEMGDQFVESMKNVAMEIRACQLKAKKGTSFFEAGWLLQMPIDDSQDEREIQKAIRACLAFFYLEVYEAKFGCGSNYLKLLWEIQNLTIKKYEQKYSE